MSRKFANVDKESPRLFLKRHPNSLLLYAVSDDAWLRGRTLSSCCADAVSGGATFLQLRSKLATTEELIREYREIRCEIAKRGVGRRVPFVIDDDVEAAYLADADGVHVGQSDASCAYARARLGEGAIVGVSVQTVEQARIAQSEGADYLGVGALYKTATKPEAADVSLETLWDICASVSIPVVAIGGLNADTIPSLRDTGVYGAAVVSAIFAADDIACHAGELQALCACTRFREDC